MQINFSDISNAIFYPLKSWAEHSTGNWNLLIGFGFLLLMSSAILLMYFIRKLGKKTNGRIASF